jgi:hypothetical protein
MSAEMIPESKRVGTRKWESMRRERREALP